MALLEEVQADTSGVPSGTPETYLSIEGVGKTYNPKSRRAVNAVAPTDCTIESGQFVSLLGPSGCGKSTLLMMAGGLEDITEGDISVGGTPMTGPREDIGIMFQDPTLLPWKSAIENVMFPYRVFKRPPDDLRVRAEALLDQVGLHGFYDHKPGQLSGGMRQRVAICRALIYEPELLLMDEPFSALDAITRDEMNAVLMRMWESYHKTALFVTHSIREAVFLSDRVLVMSSRPGRIIEDITIPFPRPRTLEIGETTEFNEICGYLRGRIEHQSLPGMADD
ncbi:MAG: ABC transporter ATP-binding protein [Alphaproteobacteria bacterium]